MSAPLYDSRSHTRLSSIAFLHRRGPDNHHFNSYEETFVAKMVGLKRTGVDFKELAREAINEKLGEGPTEVLHVSGRARSRGTPIFRGSDFKKIRERCHRNDPIARRASAGLFPERGSTSQAYLEVVRQLRPSADGASEAQKLRYLHDHRIEDEQGNYADDAN
jgi:hypothetical protein